MSTIALKSDVAELVVLSVLAEGAAYGYAITREVAARSQGTFKLGPGQLYPLLSKLERSGLVTTSWEEVKADGSEPDAPGRRRKWYSLSAKGQKRLAQRVEAHRTMTALIDSFIGGRAQGAPA